MTGQQERAPPLAAPDRTSPAMFIVVPALTALAFLAARRDPFKLTMNLAPFFVPFPWSLAFSAGSVIQAAMQWDQAKSGSINPLAGLEWR